MNLGDEAVIHAGIKILASEVFLNAVAHGFYGTFEVNADSLKQVNKGERIALMHSELSEALEGIRKPGPDHNCPAFTGEEIELADCIIRILDYCQAFNLRISDAILAKHKYNLTREYLHGKAF